ncbi:MAG: ATP-binding protein, partial [Prevotellaceae bacterium]|nr:ATP-binding protein [Prevotellaceae bacterium]
MLPIRKMPIGIQDFEDLRVNGYVYVDKTAYLYRMVTMGKPYFLSRPRRFGKSLFLSTLKAYFLGKKELFEGLAIAELEKEWTEYPVFYVDLNEEGFTDIHSLHAALNTNLKRLEDTWGKDERDATPASRLSGLIRRACEKSGRKVVVLVDEYDKPLVSTLDKADVNSAMRDALKGFYGVLKSADAYLRFVMLTGVTKFSKVSVFSDLNQLMDISMDKQYNGICGISESELIAEFQPEIAALADETGKSYGDVLAELKKRYDGYHFCENTEGMYNPFSLLNTFSKRKFKNYWFETGTPTFLAEMLKNVNFGIDNLENDVKISMQNIFDYRVGTDNPLPLLYQSGYLTVKGYDAQLDEYVLGFPNGEVKYGFYNELLPVYMPGKDVFSEFYAAKFVKDLLDGDVDGFMNRLCAFFADIPYDLNNKEEKHYQTVFFIFFRLMGQFVKVEPHSSTGRADAVVVTPDAVYAFEFKLSERASARAALRQIDKKGYLKPYAASGKKLVKVG